jgi:RNA recognition motif-containing protein
VFFQFHSSFERYVKCSWFLDGCKHFLFLNFSQMNIYVGNLSWGLKDQDLANLFTPFGEVASAKIVMDKFTQRSKGFGFVEMPNDEQAQAAIAQLNGSEIEGRNLVVNESRPKEGGSGNGGGGGFKKRSFGGGGGGFKKGGGGGFGGGGNRGGSGGGYNRGGSSSGGGGYRDSY